MSSGLNVFIHLPARAAAVLALAAAGATGVWAQGAGVTFTDVALEAGFQDRLGHGRALFAADFNKDGWVDFWLGNPADPIVFNDDSFILWSNGPDGDGNVTFTKGQVLLKGEIAFDGAAWDYDNDGDRDLFIGVGGQEGIGLDYLFRNDGGTFTDVSEEAGVRGPKDGAGQWVPVATSSGFPADYDNDGDLDLFVAARINNSTLPLPGGLGSRDSLFRNNGDGTFTDVTAQAGVGGELGGDRTYGSMTASWGDFDNDGWMDLYVPIHDPVDLRFYRNNGDGTFADAGLRGSDLQLGERATWASSVADFNQDGLLDVISFARSLPGSSDYHGLFINRGNWAFTNEAGAAGLGEQPTPSTMGTVAGDYDNDGYIDLFMGNGGPLFSEVDRLYRNQGAAFGGLAFANTTSLIDYAAPPDPNCVAPVLPSKGTMHTWVNTVDMLPAAPGDPLAIDTSTLVDAAEDPCNPSYPYRGHGSVLVDYDRDGDQDLAMIKGGTVIIAPEVVSTAPNRLYRNDGGNTKNWFYLTLEGTVSNRDAIGATVELVASKGGQEERSLFQHWQGYTGFSANAPEEIHFGLGDHDRIEELHIQWPSGIVTHLAGVAIRQRLKVVEEALFADTFNDGTAENWRALSGNWVVQDGMYGQAGATRGMTLREGGVLSDLSVVARVSYASGRKRIGVLARVSPDGRSYYGAILTDGRAQLYKSVNGRLTALGQPLTIEPMTRGKSYIVNLSLRGDQIGLAVDRGAPVVVEDGSILGGTIGLATDEASASFDNIAVY